MTKTPKAIAIKAKIDKWDLIKIQSSVQQKKPSLERIDNQQNGERMFAIYSSEKGLISRIYKEHKQSYKKKTTPSKSGQRI